MKSNEYPTDRITPLYYCISTYYTHESKFIDFPQISIFIPGSGYRSGVSASAEAPFSLKNGSLPIRIGIIGLNSAVRQFPFSNNYGGEYFLWIVGDMENVCTFVPSLIKVCYNLLQIRHHPNDVFSFFLDSYRGAYSEPPRIVFTSSKQFNQ